MPGHRTAVVGAGPPDLTTANQDCLLLDPDTRYFMWGNGRSTSGESEACPLWQGDFGQIDF